MVKRSALMCAAALVAAGSAAPSLVPAIAGAHVARASMHAGVKAAQMMAAPEAHLFANGRAVVRDARVTALSGSQMTVVQNWGSFAQTWNVALSTSTRFLGSRGEPALRSELSVGDLVSCSGGLDTTQTALTVRADVVLDVSRSNEAVALSGRIASIGTQRFTLATARGPITVLVASSTTITAGGANVSFSALQPGMFVLRATGTFDASSDTLTGSAITLQPSTFSAVRLLQGVVSASPASGAPTTLSLAIGSSTVTVDVASTTVLYTGSWHPLSLSQIAQGHTVRVAGTLDLQRALTLDALALRDLSVQ